jgi:hypothetical protein
MSQRYLQEIFTKKLPTKGFFYKSSDFGNGTQSSYLFMKSYHKLCLDNRLEKRPLFWSPIGRLAKTLKPSSALREYKKE